MLDEAGHAHERLSALRRCAACQAIVGERAGGAALQDAAAAIELMERADHDLVAGEAGIETGRTVKLRLRRVLRDLSGDSTFGAHLAAVEAVDRGRVAAARLERAAERRNRPPAVARRASDAEIDPCRLQRGKAEAGIGHETVHGAPSRGTQGECVSATCRRMREYGALQCGNGHGVGVDWHPHAQVAGGVCLGETTAITGHTAVDGGFGFCRGDEVPAQFLQQSALARVRRLRRRHAAGNREGAHRDHACGAGDEIDDPLHRCLALPRRDPMFHGLPWARYARWRRRVQDAERGGEAT